MLAAVYEGIEEIKLKEINEPVPTEDNIIIKVDACGICGSDVRVYFHGSDRVKPPWILGHEVAGTIIHIGKESRKDIYIKKLELKENDKIIVISTLSCGVCKYCRLGYKNLCINRNLTGYPPYQGGYAEFMPVSPLQFRNIFKIPKNMSPILATFVDPLSDIIHGLNLLDIQLGDKVMIVGSGPIGTSAAAIASLRGAFEVFLVEVLKERLSLSKNILKGFDRVNFIDIPKKVENLTNFLKAKTNCGGIDKIVVACSSKEAQEYSLNLAEKRAKILYFGGLPENQYAKLNSNIIHYGEQMILGSYASNYYEQKTALDMINLNIIPTEKIINRISRLDMINENFELIKQGKVTKAVIVTN